MSDGFHYVEYADKELFVAPAPNGVLISVTDEKAVDTDNVTFENTVELPWDQVPELWNYLGRLIASRS